MTNLDDYIKDFEKSWPNIPDMDVWPKQLKYQFKLYLLEKGYYGIKETTESEAPTPNGPAT